MSEERVEVYYERRDALRQILKNQMTLIEALEEVLCHIRAPNIRRREMHENYEATKQVLIRRFGEGFVKNKKG